MKAPCKNGSSGITLFHKPQLIKIWAAHYPYQIVFKTQHFMKYRSLYYYTA